MISKIAVDGFRSLRRFELDIRPGLNVLVGPNGAGKTNIILFFEFVRLLCTFGVGSAVSKMGGAGNIFQKRGKARFMDLITFSIHGRVQRDELFYDYEMVSAIRASVTSQDLYFESQRIRILKEDQSPYLEVSLLAKNGYEPGGESSTTVQIHHFPDANAEQGVYFGKEQIQKFFLADSMLDASILGFLQHAVPVVDEVRHDLCSRFLLNVVPTVVKAPEDSTRHPGIDSDGSGLSATLYAIKRRRPVPDGAGRFSMRRAIEHRPATWGRVLAQIRVAVPTIESIDVENEPFDNRLRAKITVGKGSNRAVLPLSALSDGTVKWMSLVVRLATSRAALLLEEPENYLHPLMQQEVVRMLRDSVLEGGFVLLSTHSETLLNAVRSEELVVVSYRAGSTRACRVANATQLNQEIASTGFGLGYYYLADAIRSA